MPTCRELIQHLARRQQRRFLQVIERTRCGDLLQDGAPIERAACWHSRRELGGCVHRDLATESGFKPSPSPRPQIAKNTAHTRYKLVIITNNYDLWSCNMKLDRYDARILA